MMMNILRMARRNVPTYSIAIILAGILGCAEDIIDMPQPEMPYSLSDSIMFNVELRQGWTDGQGKEEEDSTRGFIGYRGNSVLLKGLNDSVPLCLRVLEQPGISLMRDSKTLQAAAKGETTRATSATVENFNSFPFGMFAYYHPAASINWSQTNAMWNNESISKESTYWKPTAPGISYWPTHGYMSFFAYYPYEDIQLTTSSASHNGYPYLDYTLEDDVKWKHKDLIVAKSTGVDCGNHGDLPVSLSFTHALSAIKFKIGSNTSIHPMTISKITIKGVCSTGRYTFSDNLTAASSWSNQGNKKDYHVELSPAFSTHTNPANSSTLKANSMITREVETFMMIPQTLTSDAKVRIEYYDDVDKRANMALEADLSTITSQWQPNKEYIYTLTPTSNNWEQYILTVESPEDFDYTGQSAAKTTSDTYKITSYRVKSNNGVQSTENIRWKAEIFDINADVSKDTPLGTTTSDNTSLGLTAFTYNGNGGTTASTYTVGMTATSIIESGTKTDLTHTERLKATAAKGTSSDPWDLSLHDPMGNPSQMNTANCYIVNGPGWYKIPLVYGNAIKNGQWNQAAYMTYVEKNSMFAGDSYANQHEILQVFKNHLDNGITSPYIYDNAGCRTSDMKDAVIVWQDVQDLVTNVRLSSEKHFIEFYVDPNNANLAQGNCLIALRDNTSTTDAFNDAYKDDATYSTTKKRIARGTESDGTGNNGTDVTVERTGRIMWSWHIWVTDEGVTNTKTVRNHTGYTYHLMSTNLGRRSFNVSTFKAYGSRRYKVVVSQLNDAGTVHQDGQSAIFYIIQNGGTTEDATAGTNPCYQWGRKDPLVPSAPKTDYSNIYSVCETIYCPDGYSYGGAKRAGTMGDVIQHPHLFFNYLGAGGHGCSWMWPSYDNLWSPNNNKLGNYDEMGIKSIYDPCPVGFKVAPSNALSGFVKLANGQTYPADGTIYNAGRTGNAGDWSPATFDGLNVASTTTDGIYVYNIANSIAGYQNGGTMFFPMCGYRIRPGHNYTNVGTNTNCWTSMPEQPYDHACGSYLGMNTASGYPYARDGRDDAASIRGVVDR